MSKPHTPVAEILPPRPWHAGASPGVQKWRNTLLREAVMEACERAGQAYVGPDGGIVDYLSLLALTDAKTFASLLARVMPMQLNVTDMRERTHRIENVVLPAPTPRAPPAVVPMRKVEGA